MTMGEFDDDVMDDQGEIVEAERPEPVRPPPSPAPRPAPSTESIDALKEQIQKVRDDPKLSNEKRGAALLPLYEKLVQAEKAQAQQEAEAKLADPEVAKQESREITSELRNQWGSKYDERLDGNARLVVDALGEKAADRVRQINEGLALDKNERVAFDLSLAELSAESEGDATPEAATSGAEERLQSMWGSRTAEEFPYMQKGATHVFGSIEAAQRFVDRKWSGNALAQVRFALLMNKIGRRMKG